MSCTNCYNGCSEIVSDKCVKYTGVDVPILGIETGDSLSLVEQSLITFLTSTLDGLGIKPNIDPNIICQLVNNYLPTCGDITLIDVLNALIKASCDLQVQIDVINATLIDLQDQIDVIEAPYTVGCLTGVTGTSGTHAILQQLITQTCAFILDVETNYVQLVDLNTLIAAYLASITPPVTQQYQKMVPYTVVEYYGPLTNFNAGGVGLVGLGWDKIYLCNGQNGTPDKRGRVGVGVTVVPGGLAYNPNVDPAFPATNPNYTPNTPYGVNAVVLTAQNLPTHSHNPTTVTIVDPGHTHTFQNANGYTGSPSSLIGGSGAVDPITVTTSSAVTGLTNINVTVSNSSVGNNVAHPNIQPVWPCYYIMYIP